MLSKSPEKPKMSVEEGGTLSDMLSTALSPTVYSSLPGIAVVPRPGQVMASSVAGGDKKEEARMKALKRAHGEEMGGRSRKRKKAGGKGSKVRQRKEKKALTKQQKKQKRITGESLGRARHVYKVVNGDWPLSPAMYISDMRSPAVLKPVLLVNDPLKRYFESPHGNGMQEIMPDRVRNEELRRLLGLSPGEEPQYDDPDVEHLELVRMCEERWPKCPMSYEGVRPAKFNESNNKRDRIIEEVLLNPINKLCKMLGMKEVKMYWVFHCPKEARGIGYYSGKWGGGKTRTVQYTDDKLFMTAYKLFAEKYRNASEGPRPSEKTPPGRVVKFSWTDDSNVATEEIVTEKQLAKWEQVVKKRKGVIMRKGDCPTIRRKLIAEMFKLGGQWAFPLEPVRQLCLNNAKIKKGQIGGVRLSMIYYWPEDCIHFDQQDIRLWKQHTTDTPHTQTDDLPILCFARRTGLIHTFPHRYTPFGQDIWKPHWDSLLPHHKHMYTYKSVTHIGSLPMLSETLLKHAIPHAFKHVSSPEHPHSHIREYISAWEALDAKLRHEHTWQVSWRKIRAHLDSIEDKLERLSTPQK